MEELDGQYGAGVFCFSALSLKESGVGLSRLAPSILEGGRSWEGIKNLHVIREP